MTMLATETFDVLMIPEKKWIKVEVMPPWVWHPTVGIDGTKKYKETILWFEEHAFLWKLVMDGKEEMVSKDCLSYLLEVYEHRAHSFLKIPLATPIAEGG